MIDITSARDEIIAVVAVVSLVGLASLFVYQLIGALRVLYELVSDGIADRRADAAYQTFDGTYEEFERKYYK